MINQQDLIVMNHKSTKKIYRMDDRNITSVTNKEYAATICGYCKKKICLERTYFKENFPRNWVIKSKKFNGIIDYIANYITDIICVGLYIIFLMYYCNHPFTCNESLLYK